MRASPFWMPLLVILALLGTVGIAQVAGVWTTSGRSAVTPGALTPDALKGWMTLEQVSAGLGISQADLYALAKIPGEVAPSTALKDLEGSVPGFELSALKAALNARAAGSPAAGPAPEESVPGTEPETQTGSATPTPAPTVHASPTPLPAGQVLPADQIKGRMSLREVSEQCAVPLEQLLAALDLAPDTDPGTPLKDLVSAGQITEVSAVQQAVALLQK